MTQKNGLKGLLSLICFLKRTHNGILTYKLTQSSAGNWKMVTGLRFIISHLSTFILSRNLTANIAHLTGSRHMFASAPRAPDP